MRGKIGESTPKSAPQRFDFHHRSLTGQQLVLPTSRSFGSQFSKNWKSSNPDPYFIWILHLNYRGLILKAALLCDKFNPLRPQNQLIQ
jgi:hypothetical protein